MRNCRVESSLVPLPSDIFFNWALILFLKSETTCRVDKSPKGLTCSRSVDFGRKLETRLMRVSEVLGIALEDRSSYGLETVMSYIRLNQA